MKQSYPWVIHGMSLLIVGLAFLVPIALVALAMALVGVGPYCFKTESLLVWPTSWVVQGVIGLIYIKLAYPTPIGLLRGFVLIVAVWATCIVAYIGAMLIFGQFPEIPYPISELQFIFFFLPGLCFSTVYILYRNLPSGDHHLGQAKRIYAALLLGMPVTTTLFFPFLAIRICL